MSYTHYDLWVDGANGGTRWKLDHANNRRVARATASLILKRLPHAYPLAWRLYEVQERELDHGCA